MADGFKLDTGKTRWDLLPISVLTEIAKGAPVALTIKNASFLDSYFPLMGAYEAGSVDVLGPLVASLLIRLQMDTDTSWLPRAGTYGGVPFAALETTIQVMTEAAKVKYPPYNWLTVDEGRRRYVAACTRHVLAHHAGFPVDPEFNLAHLAHAACCGIFLIGCELGIENPQWDTWLRDRKGSNDDSAA